jgi:carbon storage regulator
MLVLSRKKGESIAFPDLGIEITAIRSASGRMVIGINAPQQVRIVRSELLGRVSKESEVQDAVLVSDGRGNARDA